MKALSIIPGTAQVNCIDWPEPKIERPDDVKLKVLMVGVCGTDRELVTGDRAMAPAGEKFLILGHEMLGQVVEVGSKVTSVKKGDLAVFTVRRGCQNCACCLAGAFDKCYTGNYKERGIKERHGFQAEYVVDSEEFLVKAPQELGEFGVLCEPMSVVEKAIEQTLMLQRARLPEWSDADIKNKKALVAGLGPIGLLASISLILQGFTVYGQDILDPTSSRVQIFQSIGGKYIDGRTTKPEDIPTKYGRIDLILEATGVAELAFDLFEALGTNGAYVGTGVANPHKVFSFPGGLVFHNLVLENQLVLGSVNAAKKHWQLAIENLEKAHKKWPHLLSQLITSRTHYTEFEKAFQNSNKDEIKQVISWK